MQCSNAHWNRNGERRVEGERLRAERQKQREIASPFRDSSATANCIDAAASNKEGHKLSKPISKHNFGRQIAMELAVDQTEQALSWW